MRKQQSSRGQWSREGTRYEPKAYARASDKVLSCESTRGLLTLGAHLYASLMLERAFMHARTHAARSACAYIRVARLGALSCARAHTSTREHYSRSRTRTREEFSRSPFFFSPPFSPPLSPALEGPSCLHAVLLTPSRCIRDERKWRHQSPDGGILWYTK